MRTLIKARKHLSFDPLVKVVRQAADLVPDHRKRSSEYSMADAVMSAFAMFSLKDPSLLAFQERRNDENMKNIYQIAKVPSDTQMRELLDPIEPDALRPAFNDVFRSLQRGGELKPYLFHDDAYLLSLDGTEYFASKSVHCESCLERKNKQTGESTYYHQLVGAVLVHPDQKQVIPLAPEPIVKQDGDNKNDCERNASKRLLEKIRDTHPSLRLIVVEDGLSSNAPHVRVLKKLRMSFILGVKPADHQHLYESVIDAADQGINTTFSWKEKRRRASVTCEINFVHDVPLNKSNSDLRVNFLQYSEYDSEENRTMHFSWVTDLAITKDNARQLIQGGRSRWKVENETFNTLKNQGYQFEHNFGHGKQNLSVVFAMIMMLAFLVDQTQEHTCPLFKAVRKKFTSRRAVWDHVRSHFRHFLFQDMNQLYHVIINDLAKNLPPPTAPMQRSERSSNAIQIVT